MRGRDVLIYILLLPVCLAAAATLIGFDLAPAQSEPVQELGAMTQENQTLADSCLGAAGDPAGSPRESMDRLGLHIGGSILPTAGLTGRPLSAFFVGLAASLRAPLPPVETGARLLRVAKAICNQIRWLGWLRGLDLFKNVPRGS